MVTIGGERHPPPIGDRERQVELHFWKSRINSQLNKAVRFPLKSNRIAELGSIAAHSARALYERQTRRSG